jgi:pimeloyl-ACP methyl ester carboxylesterase
MDSRMRLMDINGTALEVLSLPGPTERAPLVFLHEGLGSVALWRSREGFWPEQLCQASGRAGVVYSRRGYGASEPIPDVRGSQRLAADYMHREAWEVLPALLQHLGIQHPVLIGHSDGGTIALLYAARHRVAGCAVMAPHVKVEPVSVQAIEAAREAYEKGDLRERLARFHADVNSAFWQWCDVWLSEAFSHFDIRDLCREIQDPVLALQGMEDAYGTLAQIEDIQPHGPIERVVVPQCGHSPHRDQRAQVTQRLVDFLATLP